MVVQNVQFIPIYNNTLARLMVFMVIENFWSIASFPSLSLAFNVFFQAGFSKRNNKSLQGIALTPLHPKEDALNPITLFANHALIDLSCPLLCSPNGSLSLVLS